MSPGLGKNLNSSTPLGQVAYECSERSILLQWHHFLLTNHISPCNIHQSEYYAKITHEAYANACRKNGGRCAQEVFQSLWVW